MTFNSQINLGEMLEAVGMLFAVVAAWYSLKEYVGTVSLRENFRHEENTRKLDDIRLELGKQTGILTELAVQKATIEHLTQRLEQLERDR